MVVPLSQATVAYALTIGVLRFVPPLCCLAMAHVAPAERFSYLAFAASFNRWLAIPPTKTVWS